MLRPSTAAALIIQTRTYRILAAATILLLAFMSDAAADFSFEPRFSLSEEYNDNVFLSPDNPREDYITRIVPSLRAVYLAPLWQWEAAYAYDYRYYARDSRSNDTTHNVVLNNRTHLIRDFLFLDVMDRYRRVSLDTTRDYTRQSLFINQTDRNQFVASPYMQADLTTHTSGTAGYQYRNTWHRHRSAINSSEHKGFVEIVDELSLRTVITGGLSFTRIDAERGLGYDKIDVFLGPRHEYSESSWIWATIGNSTFRSSQPNQEADGNQLFWDAGLSHRFVTYTLTLNTALTYVDDPVRVQRREDRYTAHLLKETERTAFEASVGRWEYRNVLTKRLQNTRNGVGGRVSYRFTPDFGASYNLNIDRYENNTLDTYSMLYLNLLRFDYLFPANTRLTLEYRFQHGYSPEPELYTLNYDNNRVVLEIRKVF